MSRRWWFGGWLGGTMFLCRTLFDQIKCDDSFALTIKRIKMMNRKSLNELFSVIRKNKIDCDNYKLLVLTCFGKHWKSHFIKLCKLKMRFDSVISTKLFYYPKLSSNDLHAILLISCKLIASNDHQTIKSELTFLSTSGNNTTTYCNNRIFLKWRSSWAPGTVQFHRMNYWCKLSLSLTPAEDIWAE